MPARFKLFVSLKAALGISASLIVAMLSAGWCWADDAATAPGELAITSMGTDGTNLLLTASVPPGLESITLDTRPALDAPWNSVEQQKAPADGGELVFTYPQSTEVSRFFRLRASLVVQTPQAQQEPNVQIPQLVSAELEYVATASLASRLSNGNAVFHFKGKVDGSDKILITRDGALWDHIDWNYPPEPVTVNDTKWNPLGKNYLSAIAPTKFLPASFSLDSVELEVVKGRDIVALERARNALIVYLDDAWAGPDDYEFQINFHTNEAKLPAARSSVPARLTISAQIDGSDRIKITSRGAFLEHKSFALPRNLIVNGIPWNPRRTNGLPNVGATRFLPDGVDFSTAKIISRKGRDLATAWGAKDELWVCFADNPNGSDAYEIEIAFGSEESQQ